MLERQRGVVINIGSFAGEITLPFFGVYSATKVGFSKPLALFVVPVVFVVSVVGSGGDGGGGGGGGGGEVSSTVAATGGRLTVQRSWNSSVPTPVQTVICALRQKQTPMSICSCLCVYLSETKAHVYDICSCLCVHLSETKAHV